jgi:hypothetical protein
MSPITSSAPRRSYGYLAVAASDFPAFDRCNNPLTQIHAVRLAHPILPSQSQRWNQLSPPRESRPTHFLRNALYVTKTKLHVVEGVSDYEMYDNRRCIDETTKVLGTSDSREASMQ